MEYQYLVGILKKKNFMYQAKNFSTKQSENPKLQQIEKEHQNCTRKHWQQKCAEHHANEKKLQNRIEKANELLQRHNEDTGDIYYKYNNRFVKSELKERLSEVLNGSDEK